MPWLLPHLLLPVFWSILSVFVLVATAVGENRLAQEKSPYLLQHAANPVNWYPWGDDAFAKAQAENKLVLLSIGYSTCHWCHVMNRESFSNPEIAAYLNEKFVCIKVDREERPDVDQVYMVFVQQLTGSGGWPLNVFLTPERKPFFGGTYFPPERLPGLRGPDFPSLLNRIQELWTNDESGIRAQSEKAVAMLNQLAVASPETEGGLVGWDVYQRAVEQFRSRYDEDYGGFGGAPKFPSPANLSFLLKASTLLELAPEQRESAKTMALSTLAAIASSGIRDQLGGGFHRYAVDQAWSLPHFEKMLYDQAFLAIAYSQAWQVQPRAVFKNAATDAMDYVLRDLQRPGGGFYSAEDAESYPVEGANEKEEGAFYLWSEEQINDALLEEDRSLAKAYYAVRASGNLPQGQLGAEELPGRNTLRTEQPLDEVAQALGMETKKAAGRLSAIRERLLGARDQRPRPHLDDKIIASWNGMTISALARAFALFGNQAFLQGAQSAAAFLKERLYDSESRTLKRAFREGVFAIDAFSEDYAFVIQGSLDLYDADGDVAWLDWADTLQKRQIELFYDESTKGFLRFAPNPEIVFKPRVEDFDGASPAANSIAVRNLSRLGQIFDNSEYMERARAMVLGLSSTVEASPTRLPSLLDAALFVAKNSIQIVIAADSESRGLEAMLAVAQRPLLPNRVLLFADGGSGQEFLSKHLEFIRGMVPIDGKASAYVCESYVCQLPVSEPSALEAQLLDLIAPASSAGY